ncbi:MAG: hypothetical protein KC466_02755 [Myxococcales bacterium]|nr:hypothetical protein [Myxococcales bacterium]
MRVRSVAVRVVAVSLLLHPLALADVGASVADLVAGATGEQCATLRAGQRIRQAVGLSLQTTPCTFLAGLTSANQAPNTLANKPVLSRDGSLLVFVSGATNMVPGITSGRNHIWVRDIPAGTTALVSRAFDGAEANLSSGFPGLSGDGRFASFQTQSWNILPPAVPAILNDTYVRDLVTDTIERGSITPGGDPDFGTQGVLNEDGRFLAYNSGGNGGQVYVRDRTLGVTTVASVQTGGAPANDGSNTPSINDDGRHVAFQSSAVNLVFGDGNAHTDIFAHDRETVTTTLLSVGAFGVQANAECANPSISGDGRYVVYESKATNLVPTVTVPANTSQIYLRDRDVDGNGAFDEAGAASATRIVSANEMGEPADADATLPVISDDGRFVAFSSGATNLVAGDGNHTVDVFVVELATGAVTRANVTSAGAEVTSFSGASTLSISGDGRFVAFNASASALSPLASGNSVVYVRDRDLTEGL